MLKLTSSIQFVRTFRIPGKTSVWVVEKTWHGFDGRHRDSDRRSRSKTRSSWRMFSSGKASKQSDSTSSSWFIETWAVDSSHHRSMTQEMRLIELELKEEEDQLGSGWEWQQGHAVTIVSQGMNFSDYEMGTLKNWGEEGLRRLLSCDRRYQEDELEFLVREFDRRNEREEVGRGNVSKLSKNGKRLALNVPLPSRATSLSVILPSLLSLPSITLNITSLLPLAPLSLSPLSLVGHSSAAVRKKHHTTFSFLNSLFPLFQYDVWLSPSSPQDSVDCEWHRMTFGSSGTGCC